MKVLVQLALACGLLFVSPTGGQTGSSGTRYTYDANGNVSSKTEDGVVWSYVYDTRDLLVRVLRDGELVESYLYDYQGRRVRKTTPEGMVRYVWDGDQVIAEQDETGRTIATYTHAGDRLVTVEHETDGRGAYLLDGLGSPVSLSRPDGTLAVRYHYDAWGAIEEQVGDSENPFLFTGHLFDGITGLYYAKARYYDPSTGRFTSVDPFEGMSVEPPSLHPYLYAYANPTVYVDLTGRCVGELQSGAFCQAIARYLEYQLAGDPLAIADSDVQVHEKVMVGRRQFRAQLGREPLPSEVVWIEGSRQLTAGFEVIDASGRVEADHAEWSVVSAGVGARLAYSASRAAGAASGAALSAAAKEVADDVAGEVLGVSPGNAQALAGDARRMWSGGRPGSAGPTGTVGESADGRLELATTPASLERNPAAEAVRWIDEGGNLRAGRGPGMSPQAYDYQSGTPGARSNVATGRGQAPALDYQSTAAVPATVKFDGLTGSELIDRKIAVHTGAKTRSLAHRQSAALRQHGLSGVWELPTPAEAARASQLLTEEGIANITVRVAPP